MEKLLEDTLKNIRACLISSKGKCDVKQLKNDYRMLMGYEIPFKKLGHRSLDEFVQNAPSLLVTKSQNGQLLVDAKPNEKSSHIANMVARQKSSKKKRSIPPRNYKNIAVLEKNPSTKWRPKNVSKKWPTHKSASLPASHNQFVTMSPVKKSNITKSTNNGTNSKEHNSYSGPTLNRSQFVQKKVDLDRVSLGSDSFSGSDKSYRSLYEAAARNIEQLQIESMAAVDSNSSLWNDWSSDYSSSDNKKQELKHTNQEIKATKTGNSILDLCTFLAANKMPDANFKVIKRKDRSLNRTYHDCKLIIDSKSYSSYPQDFFSENAAKQYVAEQALADLVPKSKNKPDMLLSAEKDILERIPPMVEKHYHGIWDWQLEANYVDDFREQLPSNWLEIVDTSPSISVERCLENKFVLRYCQPGEILQKGKKSLSRPTPDLSVASNTINFNEAGLLVAEVTCVVSAEEIWCRQVDTPESEAFVDMAIEMNKEIASSKPVPPDAVSVGSFYVALLENTYLRVRVLDTTQTDVNCFLIDFGDDVTVNKRNIYPITRNLAKIQAQAFICRLAGLEDLYEFSVNSDHLFKLIGQNVQIERDLQSKQDRNDPVLTAVMYDLETKVCINKELISLITFESALPTLRKDQLNEVLITHIEPDGYVYVNLQTPGLDKLQSLLCDLEASILENPPDLAGSLITSENSTDRLYMAQYSKDNHWYRMKIIDWSPNREHAQIYFVDYGNTDIIQMKKEKLYPLDEISDVISQYPEQAVRVRMLVENIPKDFVEKVGNLTPDHEPVVLKHVDTAGNGDFVGEFFKRSESDGLLISVNKAISLERELNSLGDKNNNSSNKSLKMRRLISLNQFEVATQSNKNVPSAGSLKCPEIPKAGNYFDVNVPCAVSPWNFFVQPYNSSKKLSLLMSMLQTRYANTQLTPLHIDSIEPGKIYASKYEDGCWYRTSVIKVIHSGSISVFYCDFGYYANLTLQQLVPLGVEFTELPFQAIKAKLSDIKPMQDKWTMEDCKFFQKMVCNKSFVSVLVGIEKDELYRCDTVLLLKLIDTSTQKDIHIDEVLIEKQIAIKAN